MYQPLTRGRTIRVLALHPPLVSNQRLEITLSEVSLSDANPPCYEAISYVWGRPQPDQENIDKENSVYSRPCGTFLNITANCASMLRRLRLAHKDRILWVDAICINQSDTLEKDAQVAMMGDVYNRARRVIIDIGEASKTSDEALTCLEKVAYIVVDCQRDILHSFQSGLWTKEVVNDLYQRPWFSRIWVLQEAFMAREAVVMCGTRMVPWWWFRPWRIWIDSTPAWEEEPWHAALPEKIPRAITAGSVATNGRYNVRRDLLNVLCQSRSCGATNPRDKVFAVLGMMDEIPPELTPVYGDTVLDVYVRTAAYLLNTTGLTFLSAVQQLRSERSDCKPVQDLPSWVPDWGLPILQDWTIGLRTFEHLSSALTGVTEATSLVYYPLSAGGSTQPCAQIVGSNCLKVRGLLVDTIRRICKERISDDNPHPALTKRSQHGRNFISDCFKYRTELKNRADRDFPLPCLPRPRPWQPRTDEGRIHPPEWLAQDVGLPVLDPLKFDDNGLSEIWPHFLGDRRLVLSEKGYIGLAPRSVEVGDSICCFMGANVPFILSQQKGSVGQFKLVGEAYIYGVMEGEAFNDPRARLMDFVIR